LEEVRAPLYIDATADILVARAAGCRVALGPEGPEDWGEPSATREGGLVLNNATLCYRVARRAPGGPAHLQPLPAGIDPDQLRPVTSIRTYPNGDLNMNPLHLMTGREALDLGPRARAVAEARTLAHWHLLQTRFGWADWRLVWLSPMLGVRESYRLVGEYVLREQDLVAGLAGQDHPDIVALADHSMDFHGARPSREVPAGPYGVPFRCLVAREVTNLLVACRGASFSSIAASSCRLSRTMMVLGQAAGTAAALFGGRAGAFEAGRLRDQLRRDGVALDLQTGYLEAMGLRPLLVPRGDPARRS
ncbi:MAG: FAD-dependent oxidoreductase, partial [Gemmatimonadota bacterium]